MSRIHDNRPDSTAPDGVEDRFLDLAEYAAASSFLPEQYDYLQTLPFERAMKVIAAAVPVGLLHAIYVSVVNHHMQNTIDVKLEDTPVSIVAGKKLRVQRSGWSPEHPVGSQARKNAVARITKMHNVYHVNNEILEKVILATRGHDCKPSSRSHQTGNFVCTRSTCTYDYSVVGECEYTC